jgi:hypothetical protein
MLAVAEEAVAEEAAQSKLLSTSRLLIQPM